MYFDFFCKKKLCRIKTVITFTYGLEKKCNIWKTIYAKCYIRFQPPYTICTNSWFSKIQREIWKQEYFRFCQKIRKNNFLNFLKFFCCLFQFLIILNVSHYFGILEFLYFLLFLKYFEYLINNWIMHKYYLKFTIAYY
jgi:hypothetical protein